MTIPDDVMEAARKIAEDIGTRHFDEFGYGYDVASVPRDMELIARAIMAERARCAKIADGYPLLWEESETAAQAIRKLAAVEIAAAIRSGS